jgi:hypothetical protein
MMAELGLQLPSPHRRPLSKKYSFKTYVLKGIVRKLASESGEITLEPKHIRQVDFNTPVNVVN